MGKFNLLLIISLFYTNIMQPSITPQPRSPIFGNKKQPSAIAELTNEQPSRFIRTTRRSQNAPETRQQNDNQALIVPSEKEGLATSLSEPKPAVVKPAQAKPDATHIPVTLPIDTTPATKIPRPLSTRADRPATSQRALTVRSRSEIASKDTTLTFTDFFRSIPNSMQPSVAAGLKLMGLDLRNLDISPNNLNKLFRKFALKYHPDKTGGKTATEFKSITAATAALREFSQQREAARIEAPKQPKLLTAPKIAKSNLANAELRPHEQKPTRPTPNVIDEQKLERQAKADERTRELIHELINEALANLNKIERAHANAKLYHTSRGLREKFIKEYDALKAALELFAERNFITEQERREYLSRLVTAKDEISATITRPGRLLDKFIFRRGYSRIAPDAGGEYYDKAVFDVGPL